MLSLSYPARSSASPASSSSGGAQSVGQSAAAEPTAQVESATQAASKAAFELANQQRTAAGLSALTWNSGLEQASAVRAVEASQSFSHTRPDGSDWWTVNSNLMYGENLAKGYDSADAAVQAWMASPTHKANIMDAEFTSGAIAIHVSNGQWFWAQEFGF